MARQYGFNNQLLLKRESSYGVDPSGNYQKFYCANFGLKGTRPQQIEHLAGDGRDPKRIFQDALDVRGSIGLPVDMRNLGYFLTGLLGNPSTSGSSTYTHTFKSGAASLPSYAIENGHASVADYFLYLGCMVNSLSFTFDKQGPARCVAALVAQSEATNGTSQGGTPAEHTLTQAGQLQGTVKQGGTAIANLNPGATLVYANNLEEIDTLGQTNGQLEGIDPGTTRCSGSISTRFASTTLYDNAVAGTPVDLEFAYTISASLKLVMTVHEAYLEQSAPEVDGPGGVNADFNFEALYNTSATSMFTAVLTNDLAGTVYTS